MRAVGYIAGQTVKELVRDRILWAFFAAALAMIAFSMLLGTLSFIEQVKITVDMGLAMIHMLSLAMSIFIGVNLVGKEIKNRTIYSVLARPISRLEYLAGKYTGLMSIIGISCFILGAALLILLALLRTAPTQSLIVAIVGIYFEMAVVASFTLLLSLVSSPLIASFASVAWWVSGTFSTDIAYFSSKAEDGTTRVAGKILYYLVPRLDLFQIRNRVVYEPFIAGHEVLEFMIYAVLLVGLLMAASLWIFQRKEL